MEAGKDLQGGGEEERREAARALGSARTPAKSEAAKRRNESRKGVPRSPEVIEKIKKTKAERREKLLAERKAQGIEEPPKRTPGRPKKAAEESVKEKRPSGRPRKTGTS